MTFIIMVLSIECSYAECHNYLNVMLNVVTPKVVILSIIMLNALLCWVSWRHSRSLLTVWNRLKRCSRNTSLFVLGIRNQETTIMTLTLGISVTRKLIKILPNCCKKWPKHAKISASKLNLKIQNINFKPHLKL